MNFYEPNFPAGEQKQPNNTSHATRTSHAWPLKHACRTWTTQKATHSKYTIYLIHALDALRFCVLSINLNCPKLYVYRRAWLLRLRGACCYSATAARLLACCWIRLTQQRPKRTTFAARRQILGGPKCECVLAMAETHACRPFWRPSTDVFLGGGGGAQRFWFAAVFII